MQVLIDRDSCIGSGNCCSALPAVFDLDVVGIAVVRDADGATEDEIRRVVGLCPAYAITVRLDDA
jgi:ferredoxin